MEATFIQRKDGKREVKYGKIDKEDDMIIADTHDLCPDTFNFIQNAPLEEIKDLIDNVLGYYS